MPSRADPSDPAADARAWAASGALALTGRADGPPLGPPTRLVPALTEVASRLGLGPADALALLGERAAVTGHSRRGTTSCGGATRLLPTADGWLALSLARDDDLDLLPAWLGVLVEPGEDPWPAVAEVAAIVPTTHLLAAAEGLGLPVAGLGEQPTAGRPLDELPVGWLPVQGPSTPPGAALDGLRVVDLTSLWAGPLCGAVLADLGADVVKVESTERPDGARLGPPALFDLLNAGKRSVALDLQADAGRAALRTLVHAADVVLEASRPRALRAMGIDAEAAVAEGPRLWVSITAHGRAGAAGLRVGFGDDAAVAGGLVAWEGDQPRFCADAVGDPLAGMTAAAAVREALERGGRWLVDLSLAEVAAHHAGPPLPVDGRLEAAAPRARPARGEAPALGQHTDAVLGELA